jgi:hypothetical protein
MTWMNLKNILLSEISTSLRKTDATGFSLYKICKILNFIELNGDMVASRARVRGNR